MRRELSGWLGRFFQRDRLERDLDRELRFHVDRYTGELLAQGVPPEEAARRAKLAFGGPEQIKEECRDARGTRWIEDFLRDLRFGMRLLRRAPVFAGAAVASLALGIGANTAIFSLMDLVMLRMLPVREPERLVQAQKLTAENHRGGLSYPMYEELRSGLRSFESLLAHSPAREREIAIDGRAETVKVEMVSDNYHEALGVRAMLGSAFRGEPAGPVAVISRDYWKRRFGGDPAAIGKPFQLGKAVFTVGGVMPAEFTGTVAGTSPDITVPMSMDGAIRGGRGWTAERGISWVSLLGRLSEGVTIEQARAEAATVFSRVLDANKQLRPPGKSRDAFLAQRLELYPAGNGFDGLRRQFAGPLAILMGIVALVLLIACANIANLLLARCSARGREIAVRLAIGAGRGRIARQLAAEGLLLAGLGGALGVALAVWFGNVLITMMSNGGERISIAVRPDARVLAFACCISLAACLLFSLAPAVQAARGSLQPALAGIRAARWRLGKGLIVAQSAISLLLLIAAGLFGRTLYNMYSQDTGFDRGGVVTFSVDAEKAGYRRDAIQPLYQRILAELRSLPGVTSASAVFFPPIAGAAWDSNIVVEGYTHAPGESDESHLNSVGPDFFRTYGTPVVLGREFDDRDTLTSKPVAVVNEAFARHYFPDRSPLGARLRRGGRDQPALEIVGVVKDMKYRDMRLPPPRTVYFAASQQESGRGWDCLVVRSTLAEGALLGSIGSALARVDRSLHALEARSMSEAVSRSLLHERMLATLAGAFGGLALLLAAVGIYGVMAFQVARRRREIGIRAALGAGPREVVEMVVAQTARLVLLGAAIGVPCALALAGVTRSILYGIAPTDPVTFAGAVAVLGAVAVVAAWFPGRAAARIDPTEALRAE